MTDRAALIELRDAVVAGKWDHSPDGVARKVFPYRSASIDDLGLTAVEAFNGSVDAAIALLEAVLPGWRWLVANTGQDGRELPNAIVLTDATVERDDHTFIAEAETPARALLIATLNAMIAKEPTDV